MIPPLGTHVAPEWFDREPPQKPERLEKDPPHQPEPEHADEPLIRDPEAPPLRGSTITRPNALFAAKPPATTARSVSNKNGIEEFFEDLPDDNVKLGVLMYFIGVTCIWLGAAADFIRDKWKARRASSTSSTTASPPLRDTQIEAKTTAPFRALDDIKEIVSFLRTNLVTAEDLKDTALATNNASLAMNALTKEAKEGDTSVSPEFVREKAGVLHVLGEMFEFLGAFKEMRTAYDLLVKYQVLYLVGRQQTWYQLEDFRNRGGSMTSKLLIFGNAVRAFDILRKNNVWKNDFRSFVDSIVHDESQLSPLRELVSGTITADDIDKIAKGAMTKALESFQDDWEKTTPASAKMQEWRERLGRIETHIGKAREARLGRRK